MNQFSRKSFLQSTSLGSLALASLVGRSTASQAAERAVDESPLAQRQPPFPAKAKRIIHLFMNGGPSQMDTFDPKPELSRLDGQELPESIKKTLQPVQRKRAGHIFGSPFQFARQGQSGLNVSELFPNVAKHADELCVVRSMQGEIANHTPGLLLTNCGHSTLARPSLGSWLLYGLGNESDELPGFVVLCPRGLPTAQSRNWTSAFMPGVYQGTHIDTEARGGQLVPNLTRSDVRVGTQRAQVQLTQFLNQRHATLRPGDQRLESRIHSMELAFRMQSAGTDAFDLASEPQHVLDDYGDTIQGRNLLIARRLAERGVRYIQCYHGAGQPWDNHGSIVKNIKRLTSESDRPIAALLKDLKQRGMLKDTLVIWGGEMGRTPTVQKVKNPATVGRDHHIDGYTIWMAGGGVRGGTTYGATDELGMKVVENPVSLHDLHATILHQMGFDHKELTYRYSSRDFRLTDVHGRIIDDILA
ncbi:DUF1501 domain-containing protein [Planctomycetes bacterium K23_9]|uniref:Sulfatase n=1 Tax=Stieleria marina TaxID=1930275 RepID=A0A517NTF6_9BACT|nr:hypothetical protein K239x_23580 [Planctomycetes bacterium K23_9]